MRPGVRVRAAALVLVTVALTGCETTAEKSAQLEKAAKAHGGGVIHNVRRSIARESTKIKVGAASVVHDSEGAAAVVTLHNISSMTLANIPIQIDVKGASGASIYSNASGGLAPSLFSVALLPAHRTITWIDDQVPGAGTPVSVSARVGEGTPVTGTAPKLTVSGARLAGEPASGVQVEGSVVNHSQTDQRELVVYALAQRAGAIIAAGRAVLPLAAAGVSTRFELFFVGNPSGGRLELSAPATTAG